MIWLSKGYSPFFLSSCFVLGKKKRKKPTGSLSSVHKETTWGSQRKRLGRRGGRAALASGLSQPRSFSAAEAAKEPALLPASLHPSGTAARPRTRFGRCPGKKTRTLLCLCRGKLRRATAFLVWVRKKADPESRTALLAGLVQGEES